MGEMPHLKVAHLTLVFRGVFSVCCLFYGIFSVVIDTATNGVIDIMFGKPQGTLGDPKGILSTILDLVEICHMGTLKKAEIEAVPNIEFILIGIAWFTLRGP